jgi:kynurenine formamidase
MGTHIDGPAHMIEIGPFTDHCPPTGLFLSSPLVVDIECPDSKLICADDLKRYRACLAKCDILLLRTGFSVYRQSDPQRYRQKNPGMESSCARFIVENCPNLVCIGMDTISFAASEHLAEGIEAHKILFRRKPPVFLIEDILLDHDLTNLKQVIVIPFFIEGIDSCPCTVIAEFARHGSVRASMNRGQFDDSRRPSSCPNVEP